MLSDPSNLNNIPKIQVTHSNVERDGSAINANTLPENTETQKYLVEAIVAELVALDGPLNASQALSETYARLYKENKLLSPALLEIAVDLLNAYQYSNDWSEEKSLRAIGKISGILDFAQLDSQPLAETLLKLTPGRERSDFKEIIAIHKLDDALAYAGEVEAALDLHDDPSPDIKNQIRTKAIQGMVRRGSIGEALKTLTLITDPTNRIIAQMTIAEAKRCPIEIASALLNDALNTTTTTTLSPTPQIENSLKCTYQLKIAGSMQKRGLNFSEAVREAVFSSICAETTSGIEHDKIAALLDAAAFLPERNKFLAGLSAPQRLDALISIANERHYNKNDYSDILLLAIAAFDEIKALENQRYLIQANSWKLAQLALGAGEVEQAQKLFLETPSGSGYERPSEAGDTIGKLAYHLHISGKPNEAGEALGFASGTWERNSAHRSFAAHIAVEYGLNAGLETLAERESEQQGNTFGLVRMANMLAANGMLASALMAADRVPETDQNFNFVRKVVWYEALYYALTERGALSA